MNFIRNEAAIEFPLAKKFHAAVRSQQPASDFVAAKNHKLGCYKVVGSKDYSSSTRFRLWVFSGIKTKGYTWLRPCS